MPELTFGEKLLIARKQLDLYQYEMAERLGVHPNSLTKYERGEGKPHAAVVRMFDLLCEQQGIRFDEYESGEKSKGAAMKIVLAEKVSPATLAVFAAEPGWEVKTHDQLPEGLPAALADADALVVRSAVQVDDALMEHAPKLRVIGRAGVGVDNIDAEAATRRGIVVMNTPGANAVAVAELTIGLMIALARKVPAANATMHAGKWEKKNRCRARNCAARRWAFWGWGGIGLEVARRARGFGMEIIGSDPFVSAAVARENGIALVPVEELFARADYLTLHVGLTPQTNGIINAKTLATMKKGVRIINCARGELVCEADLAAALKSGQVAGAALDVFSVEPPKESPYFGLDNVILSPHIAGSTAEAQEAVGVQIAQQVREYLKLGVVQNAVNLPSLSHEEYVQLAPYIDLAGRLGSFLAQAGKGGIEAIDLVYGGALAEAKTELVRNAAIAGLLEGSENVNRINACGGSPGKRNPRARGERREPSRRSGVGAHRGAAHGGGRKPRQRDGDSRGAAAAAGVRRHRHRDAARRHPAGVPQPGRARRDRPHRNHSRPAGREHRQLRAGPRAPQSERRRKPVKALAVVQVDEPVSESVLEALKVIEALLEARLVKLPDGK